MVERPPFAGARVLPELAFGRSQLRFRKPEPAIDFTEAQVLEPADLGIAERTDGNDGSLQTVARRTEQTLIGS